jgi:hypothetical protein
MLPAHWQDSKESIRACNALAGDPADPDLVAFMGFEWSQVGRTPETHYGHRCVVFPETSEDSLPARPISSENREDRYLGMAAAISQGRLIQPHRWAANTSYVDHLRELTRRPLCPEEVDPLELPPDCQEVAPTPRELHRKLDRWGLEALTIPHGTTWGTYTPALTTLDKHLDPLQYDRERMRLVEIMSGHGNAEEYRPYRELEVDPEGETVCPEPTHDYLPCCWRAGELMRERCGDLPEDECERRVKLARRYAAARPTRPHQVLPDASAEDWLDCDQCRDCFKPAFSHRPRESVQYGMSLSREDPDAPGEPRRFRYGFVASSDIHSARPGTGYKQVDPGAMTDRPGQGVPRFIVDLIRSGGMDDPRKPEPPTANPSPGVRGADLRTGAFLYPGGLAAVHARDRSREAIWEALQEREVFATSGPRILLWFDVLNGAAGRAPMGSQHALAENPRFEVRAVGSFEQLPGCPASSRNALGAERTAWLCHDECYHPSERRRSIAAIEVIRIRPQRSADEEPGVLIEDPWLSFPCEPDPAGCVAHFEDPEFVASGRDALYYARALEEPSQAINGAPLSTRFDDEGRPISIDPCIEWTDGCLAPVQERAWSSPIFVDFASDSASATSSSSTPRPPRQKSGSVMSTPSRASNTGGSSEPPARSKSRYRGTKAAPSAS